MRSKPKSNPSKANEKESGHFVNDNVNPIGWQPESCGRFTAKIKVLDGVQRTSQEKQLPLQSMGIAMINQLLIRMIICAKMILSIKWTLL